MINDPHHTQLALRPTYHTSAARITLHPSLDETANVNYFTTISSTTFTKCAPETTKFGEVTSYTTSY